MPSSRKEAEINPHKLTTAYNYNTSVKKLPRKEKKGRKDVETKWVRPPDNPSHV